jgi:hypothetical protein
MIVCNLGVWKGIADRLEALSEESGRLEFERT